MYGKSAIRLQMAEVQLHGLASQQMNWNRVSGKSIHGEQVKLLRWFVLEREPSVTQHDVDIGR